MTVVLKNKTLSGHPLEATFLPEKGMNMISFKCGNIEVIDQSTRHLFEERYAGLGALIGPHFHRRKPEAIPKIKNEELFPHLATIKKQGISDPFSHGIARYAPWQASHTENTLQGRLNSKDRWNDVPLADLEGQTFQMDFKSKLEPEGLKLSFAIVSETDSLVGLHYYYRLPNKKGIVTSRTKDYFLEQSMNKPIPNKWLNSNNDLSFNLEDEADFTFFPYPDPLKSQIILTTEEYDLRINYECCCQENSWQLYHPKGASFVCIEPLSSQDPRHPNLSVSSLNVTLSIIPKHSSNKV